ncbi:Chromosome transmission fidelity protein 18 [Rhodococcus sp. AW25M09]|nr:Chromosome transmission fidelity protein 18 [Rhodococcus sp. AW25M09]
MSAYIVRSVVKVTRSGAAHIRTPSVAVNGQSPVHVDSETDPAGWLRAVGSAVVDGATAGAVVDVIGAARTVVSGVGAALSPESEQPASASTTRADPAIHLPRIAYPRAVADDHRTIRQSTADLLHVQQPQGNEEGTILANMDSDQRKRGAPGRIRTCDQGIRRPLLYPLSYGGWHVRADPLEHG